MQKNTLPSSYIRPASGLVKSISLFGAIVFGIHCISLSSSGMIPFSWVASVWPGASIAWVLTIAAAISLIHGVSYAAIGTIVPKVGADYVLASRVLGPRIAFASSWTFLIASGIVCGGLIAWIPKSVLPALFQPMSIIFHSPFLADWAAAAASTRGTLIIGTVCVITVGGTMLLRTKHLLRVFSVGLLLGIIAWFIIYWSLWGASGHNDFVANWNRFMAALPHGSFAERIPLAQAAGMASSTSPTTMTFAGLIMGFWIFYGYAIPTFFAEEVRKSKIGNPFLIAAFSSVIVSWLIFTFAVLSLERLVSETWLAAEGYIANNPDAVAKVAGQTIQGFPWITFYSAILNSSWFLVGLTAFAWVYTLINLAQTYFFYCSRIILSWSLDGILPKFFLHITPSTKSPSYCVLAIALLAEVGLMDAAFGGPLGTQLAFVFFAVVTQTVAVVALMYFPFRLPAQFRRAPSFCGRKWRGIPWVTIFGGLSLLYLLWMFSAAFLFPAQGGLSAPGRTLVLLVVIALTGLAVYTSARWYHRKYDGYDILAANRTWTEE